MKATVGKRGQITIPKRLHDRLGLRPGTVLDFEETDGRLVGRKLVPIDDLDNLYGILGGRLSIAYSEVGRGASTRAGLAWRAYLTRDRGFQRTAFAGLTIIDPTQT